VGEHLLPYIFTLFLPRGQRLHAFPKFSAHLCFRKLSRSRTVLAGSSQHQLVGAPLTFHLIWPAPFSDNPFLLGNLFTNYHCLKVGVYYGLNLRNVSLMSKYHDKCNFPGKRKQDRLTPYFSEDSNVQRTQQELSESLCLRSRYFSARIHLQT
jgi:hypothetical protein